jgi:hypothetical protein
MNMHNSATYHLSTLGGFLTHFPARQPYVRDADEDADMLRQARLRSGDYLMTLATELEQIAETLQAELAPEAPALERIVTELHYVDRNYKLEPRS